MPERMLARQVGQGFPDSQILLVELLASKFHGDALLTGKGGFLEKNPILALDSGEQRGADKAVRRTALRFGPQRELKDLVGLALARRLPHSLHLADKSDLVAVVCHAPTLARL